MFLVLLVPGLFSRDLKRGCLVYTFLRFSGSKFSINFRTQAFVGFAVFSFCV